MFKFYIELIIILAIFSININARVVYLLAHGEKPKEGVMDESVEGGTVMSSMDGLGHKDDGLGYTGMLRAACMMDNFGPNAPYYRQPKRIITQQFMLQNNGDFIYNGKRGHHTSRRMYHQIYTLSLSLGIDPDAEPCCGSSFDDILRYIYTLPPEDDPVLIVNQHAVIGAIIKAAQMTHNKPVIEYDFTHEEDKVWAMIDGDIVEEWYMCCPALPPGIARCSPIAEPKWLATNPITQQPKAPINKEIEYPSFIYTPQNVGGKVNWNLNHILRKRGVPPGDECVNEDLRKLPHKNLTNFDLRKMNKREEQKQENIEDNNKINEESSSFINKANYYLVFTLIFIIISIM